MDELFRISLITQDKISKSDPDPENQHVHDYEELIIGSEGELSHFIDFKTSRYPAPYISFVTKGKVHLLNGKPVNGRFTAWVIEFKSEFLPETTFQLYSYFHGQANICFTAGERFDNMVALCRMMQSEVNQPEADLSVIRLLLSTLFTMIESGRRKLNPLNETMEGTQNFTFRNFLRLLEENYKKPESVEFYAAKLFMSSRNLNIICNNILHKSVSEIVEMRKLTEAKNLLISTSKTISEIGYEIGYSEKTYFTTIFKKKTGMTPSEFREEMSGLIS